jgi:hypothetical protein
MKKIFSCPALELFHCLPPLFHSLSLWTTVRLHGKKLKNVTNIVIGSVCSVRKIYCWVILKQQSLQPYAF